MKRTELILVSFVLIFALGAVGVFAENTTNETEDCAYMFEKYDNCSIELSDLKVNYTSCTKDLEFAEELKTNINKLYKDTQGVLTVCEDDLNNLTAEYTELDKELTQCEADKTSLRSSLSVERGKVSDYEERLGSVNGKLFGAFVGGCLLSYLGIKSKRYITNIEKEHDKRGVRRKRV